MSKNYREILDNLIPTSLTSSSSNQVIINETYKNNLGNKMLHFIYQLQNNIRRRNNGDFMVFSQDEKIKIEKRIF